MALRKKALESLKAGRKAALARLQKDYERTAALTKTGTASASELESDWRDRDRSPRLVDAATGALEAATPIREGY